MKYRVEYTDRARADALGAYEWIRQASEPAAFRWYTGLRQATDSLAQFPLRCSVAPESKLLGQEIRHLQYAGYRILFRVAGERVEIIHIRHGARATLGEDIGDTDE